MSTGNGCKWASGELEDGRVDDVVDRVSNTKALAAAYPSFVLAWSSFRKVRNWAFCLGVVDVEEPTPTPRAIPRPVEEPVEERDWNAL